MWPLSQTARRRRSSVAYAMADHMQTSLVIEALAVAARNIMIISDVTIFYSDRGSQYSVSTSQCTSHDFDDLTSELKIRRSVGRTEVCYDNA